MYKFLTSISLILLSSALYAQKLVYEPDTTKARFIPTGIRIGADAIGLTKSFVKDDYKQYEFQADIDFYRYFFNVEYGRMERSLINTQGNYQLQGSYFRLGPDINFLYKDPDKSALFFGLRYAFNNFSDQLTYTYTDAIYGDGEGTAANKDIKADWFELTTGMKVKILKVFWLGYTARFKFGVDTFERNALIPYEIPGDGRADKRSTWGFNYYLIFRLPLRKDPSIVEVQLD